MHWRETNASQPERLRLAIVGEGPDVELLPRVFASGLRAADIDADVAQLECKLDELRDCVGHLAESGFKAVSVGNPHKPLAASLAKRFFVVKHALGVANALKLGEEIYAQNTEVPAFMALIADLPPRTALVLGSGRAARSAVMGLFECGWHVRLWNRNLLRSRPLVALFQRYGRIELVSQADPSGCSLIVNATPLGRKAGEQPPVVWKHALPRSTALDFVFRSVHTEFLRNASRLGFRTIDGRELLVEQAALALEWWTDATIAREPMREAAGLQAAPTQ